MVINITFIQGKIIYFYVVDSIYDTSRDFIQYSATYTQSKSKEANYKTSIHKTR